MSDNEDIRFNGFENHSASRHLTLNLLHPRHRHPLHPHNRHRHRRPDPFVGSMVIFFVMPFCFVWPAASVEQSAARRRFLDAIRVGSEEANGAEETARQSQIAYSDSRVQTTKSGTTTEEEEEKEERDVRIYVYTIVVRKTIGFYR